MYYNSDKTNNNYYNTYEQELVTTDDYQETFSFLKILKIGFTILMIGLLSILSIYLVNYFSIDKKEIATIKTEELYKVNFLVLKKRTLNLLQA